MKPRRDTTVRQGHPVPVTWNVHPVTPKCWVDLESLFGPRGVCGGCWCMLWRLTASQFECQKGPGNKRALKKIVEDGQVPGVLGYDGRTPIGWCAIGPREVFSRLGRSRILKPVDDARVWSIVCFFVSQGYRRRGVSAELLKGAVRYAARRGASIVEGYPVVPKKGGIPDVFASNGLWNVFHRAGFKEVARRSPTRPIMRHTFP